MADYGITPAVVFPLFNFVLRSVQTIYEISSVPAETSDYLKTISQVLADVKVARQLRRQTSELLCKDDLIRINGVINNTEDAMKGVEVLVERARVDMSFKPGSVSAGGRLMWVIRDQNKMAAAMTRLSIASQSLHREIIVMKIVPNSPSTCEKKSEYRGRHHSNPSNSSDSDILSAPPSYLQATIDSIKERRQWDERRNSLARQRSRSSTSSSTIDSSPIPPSYPPTNPDIEDLPMASINNIAEYIRQNEEVLSSLAPGARIGPVNAFVPDKVISLPPVLESQHPTFELEGSQPLDMPRPVSSIPKSFSPQPNVQEMQRRSVVTYPLVPGVLESASSSAPELIRKNSPQSLQLRPPPSRGQSLQPPMRQARMESEVMEFETLLPGHKKPYRWRCEEPNEEHESVALHYQKPDSEAEGEDNADLPTKPFKGSSTYNDSESVLDRAPTRRRPARIQKPVHANAVPPNLSTDRLNAENRAIRRTLSRTDWQLERQDEELAKLRGQGARFHQI